jgi:hypothetical protein
MVGAALLVVAGCGGSSSIPAEQIGAEWHQASCRWKVRCGVLPDVDTCLAATRAPLTPQMAADLAAGTVRYDAAAGQRLVSAIDGLSCLRSDFELNGNGALRELEAVAAAFTGTVPTGGACFVDEECASRNCNAPGDEGCPQGTCVAPPTEIVPQGGACVPNSTTCAAGTLCSSPDPTTGVGTCALPPTAGRPCDGTAFINGCAAGLDCVEDDTGGYSCAAYPASGASCDPASFLLCDAYTETCDPATRTCRPDLSAGAACSPGGLLCDNRSYCDSTSGTCHPKLELGQPCSGPGTSDPWSTCLGDLTCDAATHTCQLGPEVAACP